MKTTTAMTAARQTKDSAKGQHDQAQRAHPPKVQHMGQQVEQQAAQQQAPIDTQSLVRAWASWRDSGQDMGVYRAFVGQCQTAGLSPVSVQEIALHAFALGSMQSLVKAELAHVALTADKHRKAGATPRKSSAQRQALLHAFDQAMGQGKKASQAITCAANQAHPPLSRTTAETWVSERSKACVIAAFDAKCQSGSSQQQAIKEVLRMAPDHQWHAVTGKRIQGWIEQREKTRAQDPLGLMAQ